jgi:hypothetical protein
MSGFGFCNTALPPQHRAKLLSEMLTVEELANCMNDEM